jgi:glycogen operon protein
VFLNGETIPSPDARGERVVDDSFLILFNAHHEPLEFMAPAKEWGARWLRLLDTADAFNEGEAADAGTHTTVDARSLALYRRTG